MACTDIACMLLDECSEISPALSEFMVWGQPFHFVICQKNSVCSYSVQPKNVLSNTVLNNAHDSVARKEKRMVNTK